MNTPEAVAALAKALHEPHIKRDDADWRDCYEDDVDAIEHMLATIPDGYHLVPDTTPTSEREAWIRRSAQNLIDYPEILDLLALLDASRAREQALREHVDRLRLMLARHRANHEGMGRLTTRYQQCDTCSEYRAYLAALAASAEQDGGAG